MIIRQSYLDKIRPFIGKGIVKAITGIRRSGKSVFVRQLLEQLRNDGVPETNLVYIDKESLDFDSIRDYRDLDAYVKTVPSARLTSVADAAAADEFDKFLQTATAQDIWKKYGYELA